MTRATRTCHHGAVAYLSAVIARTGADWRAVDVVVEDAETLDELAELLKAARRHGPVLAVLGREDDWFALVRVDGDDDDARSFVSDLAATEGGHYGSLLAPGAEPLPDVEQPASVVASAPWAGDPGLLDDVGVAAHELVDAGEGDPASVIAAIGERCGSDDLFDALR